jgi:hypothetical protein
MRFETKIGIAVLDELAVWQKLNVTAFLASAVAGGQSEVIGEPYRTDPGTTTCRCSVSQFSYTRPARMHSSGPVRRRWPGALPPRSTPMSCSRPATTMTIGPPSGSFRPASFDLSASPFTVLATTSTGCSKACLYIPDSTSALARRRAFPPRAQRPVSPPLPPIPEPVPPRPEPEPRPGGT